MREETAPIKKLATFALVEGATPADMNCNEEAQLGDSGANEPDSPIATITSFLDLCCAVHARNDVAFGV
jgi:hypothetical protein